MRRYDRNKESHTALSLKTLRYLLLSVTGMVVDIYIIKALIVVHSEPPAVLQLPDPVAEDGLAVADAESQVASKLC